MIDESKREDIPILVIRKGTPDKRFTDPTRIAGKSTKFIACAIISGVMEYYTDEDIKMMEEYLEKTRFV